MKSELTVAKIDEGNKEKHISICDVMKNNTSQILQKMEYQLPTYLQGYTDLFTAYLHSLNTLYGTCYLSEKQFFDKLGIDDKVLEPIDEYWKLVKNLTILMIETRSNFLKDYIQFRLAAIESFDKSMGSTLDYYSKSLSKFNNKK